MELLIPFANTGEKEEFDEESAVDGSMSLEKGFTTLFELKPEEGGLFILRKKFNQLMYLMSKANVEFNTQSFPNWISDADGIGTPYEYGKYAIVRYTDGNNYISTIDSNIGEPTVDSPDWTEFTAYIQSFSVEDAMTTANMLQVQVQQPSGTNGQNLVTGENTLELNTVVRNNIAGASLSSNQITLPEGSYQISSRAMVYANTINSGFSLHLYNDTDASTEVRGISLFINENLNNYAYSTETSMEGYFEITSTKTMELKIFVELQGSGQTRNGTASNNGDVEIYTDLLIWKVD